MHSSKSYQCPLCVVNIKAPTFPGIERVQLFYFTQRGRKISNKFPVCFGKLAYMWRDTPPFICCIFFILFGDQPYDILDFPRDHQTRWLCWIHEADGSDWNFAWNFSENTMHREREGTRKKKSTLGWEKLSHVRHCNFYSILEGDRGHWLFGSH